MATTRVQIGQRIFNYPFTDSLLTSVAYMNPRYDGSKLVSSQKNIYTDGDVSYGKEANIIEKTNTIYEFDWGGGAYPEIPKGGAVHLTKIISLEEYDGDNSDVYINRPSDINYNEWDVVLKRSLNINDNISLNQYEVNAQELPNNNYLILEPGLSPNSYPSNISGSGVGDILESHYLLPGFPGGSKVFATSNGNIITFTTSDDQWPTLQIDNDGNYSSSYDKTHGPSTVNTRINNILSNGGRLFISYYDKLFGKITQEPEEMEFQKVVEIESSDFSINTCTITLKEDINIDDDIGPDANKGILIWKARQGDFITLYPNIGDFDSNNYSGLKNGAFYRNFSTDSVKTHFKEITQIFGERPST